MKTESRAKFNGLDLDFRFGYNFTHMLRGDRSSILIIDEPDIYLHPNLQRKLYRDIKEMFNQYFLATHATEIINEADTSELLVINAGNATARSIRSDTEYESMLSYIGSAENADFAKIARVKKVVFVEGYDAKILRRLAAKLSLDRLASDRDSPIFQLGGFSQWRRAKETVWAFKQLLGIDLEVMCIFDRDFRCNEEIAAFRSDLLSNGVRCYVLNRKEIENYLLCAAAMARILRSKGVAGQTLEADVMRIIDMNADKMRDLTRAHISTSFLRYNKEIRSKEDDAMLLQRAIKSFDTEWINHEGRIRLAPGKELLKCVFEEMKKLYNVSISHLSIVNALHTREIPDEIRIVLGDIDLMFRN